MSSNIWLSGWFLYLIFREKPLLAAAGALVILLSRSTLRIHANVASEPLFETLLLVFFLAGARYLRDASRVAMWIMFAAAGLATLQRYLGVCLIGVGALVVISREGARALRSAAYSVRCRPSADNCPGSCCTTTLRVGRSSVRVTWAPCYLWKT